MPGVIFTVRGWRGASIELQHVAGTEAFVLSGDVANAYTVAQELAAWIMGGARPWAGGVTGVTVAVEDAGDGRVRFALTTTGTAFTAMTCSSTWLERIQISLVATVGVTRGSCSAEPGMVDLEPIDTERGPRCGAGSWRVESHHESPRLPGVELELDLVQSLALTEALRLAPQPRSLWGFDELEQVWRYWICGAVSVDDVEDDPTRQRATLELLGSP